MQSTIWNGTLHCDINHRVDIAYYVNKTVLYEHNEISSLENTNC